MGAFECFDMALFPVLPCVAVLFAVACHGHNHVIKIDWKIPMNPATKTASVGKHLQFVWTGYHNVYKMKDKAAFDACNFASGHATQVGGSTSPVTVDTKDLAAGHHYYACQVGAHCTAGQKLDVTLTAAPSSGSAYSSGSAGGS